LKREGKRDRGKEGQKDEGTGETRKLTGNPSIPPSLNPSVSPSLFIRWCFAELNGFLAAFARPEFESRDVADVAEVI
jgi:hypothetical protein